MQQQRITRKPVKKINEAAAQYEAMEHEELLQRARRASRKARQTTARAQALLKELEEF